MTQSARCDFDIVTDLCFVAYDANSGDIVAIHEFQSERGSSTATPDIEEFRQQTIRNLPKRSIKVFKLPEEMTLKPDVKYWVDPKCEEIRELPESRAARAQEGFRLSF